MYKPAESNEYKQVQQELATGWNSGDVHSVATQVLLPEGLAIHLGLKHNTTEGGDSFLGDTLIGRHGSGSEVVIPGAHSWDGSYTDLTVKWKEHEWRIQTAHDGRDAVILPTPLPGSVRANLPPTIVASVDFLWNRDGTTRRVADHIVASSASGEIPVFCTCESPQLAKQSRPAVYFPVRAPYFAEDFTHPIGISSGKRRSLDEIEAAISREQKRYRDAIASAGKRGATLDAIETTIGWDTVYEPERQRVVSPVSRVWSVGWGGYVIFEWDTLFAATMSSIGSRDLAYANAIETLNEATQVGVVPNYARAGDWKSSDRSEPPVGAITVLGIYKRFHDRWFLRDTFEPLLRWNRWWSGHRDMDGYLTWGSDGANEPQNLDDESRGTRTGAILESGLDNSPMYDDAAYDDNTHQLEFADVGLMSLYVADCDALAQMATELGNNAAARELKDRAAKYRSKLQSMWDDRAGIFLNKDLRTGQASHRLSPTNFYPMLAHAATPEQAHVMIQKHLLNPEEFWGLWVIPSIARNDPAFHDQNYWRGRIWGPMNYLVFLGLQNYDEPVAREEFARKSFELFSKEWQEKGHVHENYNAITGTGDDVINSDRFYHWGALLGYIAYLQDESVGSSASTENRRP